jgi:hypothetical protein
MGGILAQAARQALFVAFAVVVLPCRSKKQQATTYCSSWHVLVANKQQHQQEDDN